MASPVHTQALSAVIDVLQQRFALANICADTHLRFDLGCNSLQWIQLLVTLETQYGLSLKAQSDGAAHRQIQPGTVRELAEALSQNSQADTNITLAEDEVLDIKVHCVVSCLCHPLKALPNIDYRPLYFGVWDAEVVVDAQWRLSYHALDLSHDLFYQWYQRLFGIAVTPWYDPELSKHANIDRLLELLQQRQTNEWLMVMLDLHELPERENRFSRSPFPHYVMLESLADPDTLWMWDPDFRWQGALNKQRVLRAIAQPSVSGGYRFCTEQAQSARAADVNAYFCACFNADSTPLTQAVQNIIAAHTNGVAGCDPAHLTEALRELPVLAMRKYAYEHAFAYFWPADSCDWHLFELRCAQIDRLVKTYDRLLFAAAHYAESRKASRLRQIHRLLHLQHHRERQIKHALYSTYLQWREHQAWVQDSQLEPKIRHSNSPRRELEPMWEVAEC